MLKSTVHLRSFSLSDKEQLVSIANNKAIADFVRDAFPYPYTTSDAEDFIKHCLSLDPPSVFAIEYNGVLAGAVGVEPQPDIYRMSVELGYWIGEPFQGRGIATEAVRQACHYAFDELGKNRIFCGVFEHNTASQRVLEKNGFKTEGKGIKALYKNGAFFNEIRYAKTK